MGGQRPLTRVVFYHAGVTQYHADVPADDISTAIQLAVRIIAEQGRESETDLLFWTSLSRDNTVGISPINS